MKVTPAQFAKKNTFHTPDRCWKNPVNINRTPNANVARVSAGVALLSLLPKVCNNTDGKTTHESSVNNTEFSIHSLIEDEKFFNNSANSVGTQFIKSKCWKTKLQFPHMRIDVTIDTGAEITCVSSKCINFYDYENVRRKAQDIQLTGYNGAKTIHKIMPVQCALGGNISNTPFVIIFVAVVEGLDGCLLSLDDYTYFSNIALTAIPHAPMYEKIQHGNKGKVHGTQ